MIRVRALKTQQVPVVVLMIIALLLYALLGMRTTAQNILDRPVRTFIRTPSGLSSTVQEGAVKIRDAVRSQVNQASTVGPALLGVNANPEANLRAQQAVRPAVQPPAQSTELVPPAPVAAPDTTKPGKGASAPGSASKKSAPSKNETAPGLSAFSDAGVKDKGNAGGKDKDKPNGKNLGLTKGPDKRN